MLGWKNPDFDHAGKKLTTAEKAKAKLKAKKEEKFLSKLNIKFIKIMKKIIIVSVFAALGISANVNAEYTRLVAPQY